MNEPEITDVIKTAAPLLAALRGWVESIRSREDDPAPGTHEERTVAYRRFADASSQAYMAMATLSSAEKSGNEEDIRSRKQRYIEASNESFAALHAIAQVGDVDVMDAAFPIATSVGKLGQTWAPTEPEEFVTTVRELNRAMVAFTKAARRDLQRDRVVPARRKRSRKKRR